jgi:formate hydrogenlyase transcriptional activator
MKKSQANDKKEHEVYDYNGRREEIYPERRLFENLLMRLSSRWMNASLEQLGSVIVTGLQEINAFFESDRVAVWEFSEDGQDATLAHDCTATGIKPPSRMLMHVTLPYIFDNIRRLKNLCISSIEDLPQDASVDRQYLSRSGVRSFMVIPLAVGGSARGALSMTCTRNERQWSNTDLFHLQRIGLVLASALDRLHSDRHIDQRMRFETLLSDLSASIIKSPLSGIDEEIERGLARVSQFFHADRCGLLRVDIKQKAAYVSHAYYAPGIPHVLSDVNIAGLFPWSYDEVVVRKHPVNVTATRMAELPPEALQDLRSWAAMGVRSNLTIPLFAGDTLEHIIVLQALREERSWPDEYIPRLRLLGEVFENALARKRADEEVRTSEEKFREFFKNTLGYCYIVSPEGIIQNVNKAAVRALGYRREELVGKPLETVYAPESLPKMGELSMRWKERGELHDEELVIIAKDGQKRLVLVNVEAVRDGKGNILYSTTVQTDITESRQAEEKIRKAYEEIKNLTDRLEAENTYLRTEISTCREVETIIGRSDAIKYVHYRIGQVASLDTTVLIVGETGTGKGLVARAVHEASLRKDRPMIHVNCAVLPANLIESELFGREKGAFTGAQAKQIGRFELAHKGTIFLDEIAELPIELQAKLLRVVESGEFERLGDPHSVKVDVRIIASTNRNLEEEIRDGRFREDLFYRLSVFPITVPPLRKRPEDIPLLVDALIKRLNKQMGRNITTIPQEAMLALQNYSWPGNVRELENVIERSVIMSRGPVLRLAEQLGGVQPDFAGPQEALPLGLADVERMHIERTLKALKWKIEGPNGAALALGLKPSTLRSRMKKLNIRRPQTA